MEKIKIDKLKKPLKERGEKIDKPAPDETLKAEIRDFCKNCKYNKETKKKRECKI